MEPFDFVIVGAGSSGCVLARRLSEDPECRVLLVEAGHDYLPGQEPAAILDSFPLVAYFTRDFIWRDLRVTFRPIGNGPDRPPLRNYEQARLVGGGSSINGQFANRGAPDDFDQWERLGAEGWSWDQVLPYFRRLEHDLDFAGPLHGNGGPIPIRRIFPHLWSGFTRAAVSAFEANGFSNIGDQNGAWADGYFLTTFSNAYDRRVSAAIGYLDSATRARPNLEIATRAMVTALRFEGIRATGLTLRTANGERREIDARTTVLCAGALHTPGLLMRAGIGPADRLRALGIALRSARAGVGANLNDHPSVGVAAYLTPEARLDPAIRRHIHVALRYTARTEDAVPGDMFLCPLNRTAWHSVGYRLCSLMTILNKPFSRGRMTIASADPDAEPVVDFNLLSDERDMARMIDAVRFNHALESFEVPALVDSPARLRVLTTLIYDQVSRQMPPVYGRATAFAVVLVIVVSLLLWLYLRLLGTASHYRVVSGKSFRPRLIRLRRRGAILVGSLVLLSTLVTLLLPVGMLLWSALSPFTRAWSGSALRSLSLDHFRTVLVSGNAMKVFANTLAMGLATGLIATVLGAAIAWEVVRRRRGAKILDQVASIPLAFPAIVLGLAFLELFLAAPLPLYGTLTSLVIASSVAALPYAVRYAFTGLLQLHGDLEEAALVAGAGTLRVFWRVVLPLVAPSLAASFLFSFLLSVRATAMLLLIAGPDSPIIAVTIYDMWSNGQPGELAALGLLWTAVMSVVTGGFFLLSRRFGIRVG